MCTNWCDVLINFDRPDSKSFLDGLHPKEIEQIIKKLKNSNTGFYSHNMRFCESFDDCSCIYGHESYFIDVFNLYPNCFNLVKCILKRAISRMVRSKEMLYIRYVSENEYECPEENLSPDCRFKIKTYKSLWEDQSSAKTENDINGNNVTIDDFYSIHYSECERKQQEALTWGQLIDYDPVSVIEKIGIKSCTKNRHVYLPLSPKITLTKYLGEMITWKYFKNELLHI